MTRCGLSTLGRCFLDGSMSVPWNYMGVIPITGRCECYLSAWTLCYLSARLFTAVGRLLRQGVSSNKFDPLTHESLQRPFAGLHLMQIGESDHCSVLCEPRKQSPRVFDNHFCTLAVLGS